MNCPNCGNPSPKLIPAGISKKTGKAYNAFYKCESCGKTFNAGEQKQTAGGAFVKEKMQEERIEKFVQRKEHNIKWMNALNNAALLVANGKEQDLYTTACNIYAMEAPTATGQDDINLEAVPF